MIELAKFDPAAATLKIEPATPFEPIILPDSWKPTQFDEYNLPPLSLSLTEAGIRFGLFENTKRAVEAMGMGFPDWCELKGRYEGQTALIVGGGASLKSSLPALRRALKLSRRVKVFAPNKSHDWLIARGVIPDFGILRDPAPWVVDYITPHPQVTYLIGSSVDRAVLKKFKDANARVYLVHFALDQNEEDLSEIKAKYPRKKWAAVAGFTTVGAACLPIAAHLGFTHDVIHGLDSCIPPNQNLVPAMYAYEKPKYSTELRKFTITARNGQVKFSAITNVDMALQLRDFENYLRRMPIDVRITAAGDGAIPWMCFQAGEEARAAKLKPLADHIDPDAMRRSYGAALHYDYSIGQALALRQAA